jgi:hypothetical protein
MIVDLPPTVEAEFSREELKLIDEALRAWMVAQAAIGEEGVELVKQFHQLSARIKKLLAYTKG